MSNNAPKVLLTGGSGLIGREVIAPLLSDKFDIYALTTCDREFGDGVKSIKCNLFNEENLRTVFNEIKPEYLLNFAWATTGNYLTSDVNFDFVSAGMNLIKFFHLNGGKRAVYAGTCFEYEFKDSHLKESDWVNPQTVYARCKNQLHEMVEQYCQTNNISFGWGRVFYVYGKNEPETRLTGKLVKNLSADQEVVITAGPLIKDYMYTKDIAGAFAAFLSSKVNGAVNICSGSGISVEQYARCIARQLGKEHLLQFMPNCTGQPLFIVGDNTRLVREVGYSPQFTLEQGIAEIL